MLTRYWRIASIYRNPGAVPGNASDAKMTHNLDPGSCLLRLPSVKRRCGLSRSEIYRRIATGDFPAPVKLGERASAWPESEVVAWCEARIAERDARAAA